MTLNLCPPQPLTPTAPQDPVPSAAPALSAPASYPYGALVRFMPPGAARSSEDLERGPQHRLRGGGGGEVRGGHSRKPAKAPRQLPPQSRSQRLRQRSDRSAVRFPAFPPQDAQRWGPSPRLPSRGCSFNPSFKMIVPSAAAHARAYLRFPTAALGADRAPWGRASGETRPFDAHLLAQEVACQGRTVRGEFT